MGVPDDQRFETLRHAGMIAEMYEPTHRGFRAHRAASAAPSSGACRVSAGCGGRWSVARFHPAERGDAGPGDRGDDADRDRPEMPRARSRPGTTSRPGTPITVPMTPGISVSGMPSLAPRRLPREPSCTCARVPGLLCHGRPKVTRGPANRSRTQCVHGAGRTTWAHRDSPARPFSGGGVVPVSTESLVIRREGRP